MWCLGDVNLLIWRKGKAAKWRDFIWEEREREKMKDEKEFNLIRRAERRSKFVWKIGNWNFILNGTVEGDDWGWVWILGTEILFGGCPWIIWAAKFFISRQFFEGNGSRSRPFFLPFLFCPCLIFVFTFLCWSGVVSNVCELGLI